MEEKKILGTFSHEINITTNIEDFMKLVENLRKATEEIEKLVDEINNFEINLEYDKEDGE